jgi:hypothetical protein
MQVQNGITSAANNNRTLLLKMLSCAFRKNRSILRRSFGKFVMCFIVSLLVHLHVFAASHVVKQKQIVEQSARRCVTKAQTL